MTRPEPWSNRLGDYEDRDHRRSRDRARFAFFEAVRTVKPAVFDDLADEPFALFTAGEVSASALIEWSAQDSPLIERLEQWARMWNLLDERGANRWVLESALLFLDAWRALPDHHATRTVPDVGQEAERRIWNFVLNCDTLRLLTDAERTIAYDDRRFRWDPRIDRRAAIRDKILVALSDHLDTRLDEIEALTAERGAVRVRERRKREGVPFVWLASYQVTGASYVTIAKKAGVTRQAVTQAVKQDAAAIGFALRPQGQPGRPGGSVTDRRAPRR